MGLAPMTQLLLFPSLSRGPFCPQHLLYLLILRSSLCKPLETHSGWLSSRGSVVSVLLEHAYFQLATLGSIHLWSCLNPARVEVFLCTAGWLHLAHMQNHQAPQRTLSIPHQFNSLCSHFSLFRSQYFFPDEQLGLWISDALFPERV